MIEINEIIDPIENPIHQKLSLNYMSKIMTPNIPYSNIENVNKDELIAKMVHGELCGSNEFLYIHKR